MNIPELPNNFDPTSIDPSDNQLRYVFALGPLHAATASQLAPVVDGSKELWLERVGSSDQAETLAAGYAVLANPDTTADVRAEVTERLDPNGEHYIPPLLGRLAIKPESVFLLSGENPAAMHELRQSANAAMRQYFDACSLLLPHSALRTLAEHAWSLNAQATAALNQSMAAQLLERSQNTSGSVGVVATTAHYEVPQLVAEAGHPVSTTVIGSGQLPYSFEYGQRIVSLQESGNTERLSPDMVDLQDRTLLADLFYNSGLLLTAPIEGENLTAYDFHLAREAAQRHVETMTAQDVRGMLTILSNLNTAIGGLDRLNRGDAGTNRPGIVAAGRELIGAALRRWPAPSPDNP